MNRLPLLLTAVALTAACAGPDRPLTVDFKEVPSDVVLGAQSSPTPSATARPGPSVVVLPPPPSVVTLPPPPFEVPVTEPRPSLAPVPTEIPCDTADPLQAPSLEAPPTISARPVAAQYRFRNVGQFEVSGADARRGTFPASSLRTVSGALETENGFLFEVTETLGDVTTTKVYDVVERQPLGSPFAPGLYLMRVTSRAGDGQESVFAPTPELPLATFPLTRGGTVEARGVDPVTGTAMTYTSTVTGKVRVDACGEPLDSWVLELTEGRLISPDTDLDFTATYAVGTQFGGVLLQDSETFAGTVGDEGVSRTNTSTIAQVPMRGLQP